MITIDHLTVSYGNKTILNDLSVQFESDQIHGLIGLNGSGKTTFLNTLYGIKNKKTGTILFNGIKLKRSDIAYLEAENFFYSNITGEEYLSLFSSTNPSYDTNEWNKLFKLPLHELIKNYSTGMKKRLALMGIFKQNKNIIILDEPFNGLDIEFSHVLSLLVKKLKEEGKTIIITSHILGSLTTICDYIHLLKDQKIEFSKPKDHFNTIEKEIFTELETENQEIINHL